MGDAFVFDRYVNGVLMAEGVTIERARSVEDAMRVAAKLASRGPNGEAPVLVLVASPAPSLPEDVERVVERLQSAIDGLGRTGVLGIAPPMRDALALIQSLSRQLAEARAERDEAREVADLGCDANDGGPHTIIKQGSYAFCAGCGETVKHPPLSERCRKAEADRARLAAENERLRAPVGGPVPTDECGFRIGQPVRLAEPYAGDDPDLVYFVTGIRWEHRPVPARGWDITIATAEELAKGHGQTDGFAPPDLRAALASLEERT